MDQTVSEVDERLKDFVSSDHETLFSLKDHSHKITNLNNFRQGEVKNSNNIEDLKPDEL